MMDASEAVVVLLDRLPVSAQDPISELLMRVTRENEARLALIFDANQTLTGAFTPIQSEAPAEDFPSPDDSLNLNDLFGLESGVPPPAADISVSAPASSTIRTALPPLARPISIGSEQSIRTSHSFRGFPDSIFAFTCNGGVCSKIKFVSPEPNFISDCGKNIFCSFLIGNLHQFLLQLLHVALPLMWFHYRSCSNSTSN